LLLGALAILFFQARSTAGEPGSLQDGVLLTGIDRATAARAVSAAMSDAFQVKLLGPRTEVCR
jgi:hypothetical protein